MMLRYSFPFPMEVCRVLLLSWKQSVETINVSVSKYSVGLPSQQFAVPSKAEMINSAEVPAQCAMDCDVWSGNTQGVYIVMIHVGNVGMQTTGCLRSRSSIIFWKESTSFFAKKLFDKTPLGARHSDRLHSLRSKCRYDTQILQRQ